MTLAAASGPLSPQRRDWIFSAFPPLKTFWTSEAGNLSGGQKQMLSIARAMAEERKLYLIDEPTKGLAPAIVSTMAAALKELKNQGASILMVEQNARQALEIADKGYVLVQGANAHTGTGKGLLADEEVRKSFLGG